MTTTPSQPLDRWTARLRAIVGPEPPSGVVAGEFADESGHRRAVDAPLIAWLTENTTRPTKGQGLDVDLWHALANDSDLAATFSPDGPLQDADAPGRGEVAIEVWTERELSAIQALWTIGVQRDEPRLVQRAEAAAAWCVQELQPDNATAHPWGVNAFASLAASGDIEADLYAQALVHNAQVATGRVGRFAKLVLLASLRSLEVAEN
ncbi:MAG: hypothetical protein RIE77_07135 [Phycisphaerales bacterium]|jgi:hypothetical protein